MGYESRLFVVNKTDTKDERGTWCEVIATYNLCVVDNNVLQKILKHPDSDNYVLEGDKYAHEDKYGKPLKEIPLENMITILQDAVNESDYRRYPACLAMLQAFKTQETVWDNLVVLHYGY